jgi:hypothetical protein
MTQTSALLKNINVDGGMEGVSGSKCGVRWIMKFDKAEEYRTEAQKCFGNAERTFDPNAKLSWKRLAEEWLEMAGKLPAPQFHISRVDSH